MTFALSAPAEGQRVLSQAERTITVGRGNTALLTVDRALERLSVGDPNIADATLISPREVMITGMAVGTTTLLLWEQGGVARIFAIEVTADVEALERQLETLFPQIDFVITASGNTVILSGTVDDAVIARRAIEIAEATGATVVNNLQAPAAEQILLQVRFAEVNRSAVQSLGTDLAVINADRLGDALEDGDHAVETLSTGLVRLFLLGDNSSLEAQIRALKTRGMFRSLAEPNLLALEGQEASFLAGGEFPYPSVQSTGAAGSASQAISIQFREFGVRLTFTPNVTNTGAIRLRVAPEVSSLDFANGVTISGFQIPSILSRRAETNVELRPGQHLAIAGLLDNSTLQNVDKIPLLGDIPILGALFRSESIRQNRTELLVIVTPYLVGASDAPPVLPTGEPSTWEWQKSMGPPPSRPPSQRP